MLGGPVWPGVCSVGRGLRVLGVQCVYGGEGYRRLGEGWQAGCRISKGVVGTGVPYVYRFSETHIFSFDKKKNPNKEPVAV